MKKGFISIYTLLVLLLVSLFITFIFEQNQNNIDFNDDLLARKKEIYKIESITNIFIEEELDKLILKDTESYFKDYNIDLSQYIIENERFTSSYDGNRYEYHLTLTEPNKLPLNSKCYRLRISNSTNPMSDVYFRIIKNPVIFENRINSYEDVKDNIDIIKTTYPTNHYEKLVINNNFTDNINGITIVEGDLVLEKDFNFDGILVVKGEVKAYNSSKLKVNGSLILGKFKNEDIEFTYKPQIFIKYIKIDENIIKTDILSKSVY